MSTQIDRAGYASSDDAVRALIDAMYDDTQQFLASSGIDSFVLWRGSDIPKELLEGVSHDQVVESMLNAASSWSLNPNVASSFTSFSSAGGRQVVFEASIPRERIISTARTGFGCLNEWEFVVVGGDIGDLVTVSWLDNAQSSGLKLSPKTKGDF